MSYELLDRRWIELLNFQSNWLAFLIILPILSRVKYFLLIENVHISIYILSHRMKHIDFWSIFKIPFVMGKTHL